MLRVALIALLTGSGLLMPLAAGAQPPTSPPPAETPATQPTAAGLDAQRSLFDPTPREFLVGGRFSSVDGDPARFQRYEDIRDGLLFTGARYAAESPQGEWFFRGFANNVGWRDQYFAADYERPGRFAISGTWDQIPQFYSVDTRTPYTATGATLLLDDATQRAIQSGQANTTAYVPIAPQFDLEERRDIGDVSFKATPTPALEMTAAFTTQRHRGELPWGASFGFSNDVEVALPYDSRANDFSIGTEWSGGGKMLRVGYQGTWFDNLDDTLVWDSPLRLDDAVEAPGRGRMSLWPSNTAHTLSTAASAALPRRTRVTGFLSYGVWSNDSPLQPFTINSALPEIALPRTTTEGEAGVFSLNANLVSHPIDDWRFSARLREYSYNNRSPVTVINEFVSYDSEVGTSITGGPELYAHSRLTFDGDATWSAQLPVAFTVGYSHNNAGYDARIFESSGENVFRVAADAVGTSWLSFRTQYEYGDRSGSGFNEQELTEIHEQPGMRYYDLADRKRHRFTGQADFVPNDLWAFSVSGGVGNDDFHNSGMGLEETTFRTFSVGADYQHPNGFGGGVTYNYERYGGLQRSRSASPGQETDPNRDWTVDSTETVNYFSIFLMPPRLFERTEARLSYDYSHAVGSYFYAIVPGGPLTPPNQLPDVFNKLQQLRVDVRHRLTPRLAADVRYRYEPFRVYDFAFDPSVINGIVQPSSLVMGQVYRPYTAHAATVGLRVYW